MYRVLLIEDDPKSTKLLESLLKKYDQLKIVGIANELLEAINFIQILEPDLIFLDIELSGHKGLDILNFFKSPSFKTICVTGHPEYAIEAIKHSVFDYLTKPILDDELDKSLQRFFEIKSHVDNLSQKEQQISLLTSKGFEVFKIQNIVRLEAESSYSTVFFNNGKKVITSKSLKFYEEKLDPTIFVRINRKDMVNVNHIVKLYKGRYPIIELSTGKELKVSDRKRKLIRQIMST